MGDPGVEAQYVNRPSQDFLFFGTMLLEFGVSYDSSLYLTHTAQRAQVVWKRVGMGR